MDLVLAFQAAVSERDYSRSSQMIDGALANGTLQDLVSGLDELEKTQTHITLERRDHIFRYLDMWDIYFAVQISSKDVLHILQINEIRDNPQAFMVDFIRDLLDGRDKRFDQFCINVQTIIRGQYAILMPSILEQRTEELLNCKIPFKNEIPRLYCTADLLETYYGHKIVTAAYGHSNFDIVVAEDQFNLIWESLASTGLDVESMLEKIETDTWDEYVRTRRTSRIKGSVKVELDMQHHGLVELVVLHRVKSARSNVYSSDFNKQNAALLAISEAKTQICNDILADIANNPTHTLRNRALRQLGESGDLETLDLLGEIMKNSELDSTKREAARAYSSIVSRTAGLELTSAHVSARPAPMDIAKVNKIINDMISKGMPITMVDEVMSSVAVQGTSDSFEVLLRLMNNPKDIVRQSVVRSTRMLDKENAAVIIRSALNDDSPEVIHLAETEINVRWSDEVWD